MLRRLLIRGYNADTKAGCYANKGRLALALAEPILHLRQSGRFVVIEDKLVKSAYRAALAAARELPERVAAFALEACARRESTRKNLQTRRALEP